MHKYNSVATVSIQGSIIVTKYYVQPQDITKYMIFTEYVPIAAESTAGKTRLKTLPHANLFGIPESSNRCQKSNANFFKLLTHL